MIRTFCLFCAVTADCNLHVVRVVTLWIHLFWVSSLCWDGFEPQPAITQNLQKPSAAYGSGRKDVLETRSPVLWFLLNSTAQFFQTHPVFGFEHGVDLWDQGKMKACPCKGFLTWRYGSSVEQCSSLKTSSVYPRSQQIYACIKPH